MKKFSDIRQELNERGVTSAVSSKYELPSTPKTNPVSPTASTSTGGPNSPNLPKVSTRYSNGGPIMKRPSSETTPYKSPVSNSEKTVYGRRIDAPKLTSPENVSKVSRIGSIAKNAGLGALALGAGAISGIGAKKVLNLVGPADISTGTISKINKSIPSDNNLQFKGDVPSLPEYNKKSSTTTNSTQNNFKSLQTPVKKDVVNQGIKADVKLNQYPSISTNTTATTSAPSVNKPQTTPLKPVAVQKAEQIKKVSEPQVNKPDSPKTPVYRAIRAAKDDIYVPKKQEPEVKQQVGVTAKAYSQNDGGKTSFYNLERGKPSEPRNFQKVGTVANPNLRSQMADVAKSEFKTGAVGSQFPSNAKMPNLQDFAKASGMSLPPQGTKQRDQVLAAQGYKKFGESIESVAEFLSKKSSWNRNSNIEIIEDIKIELNDLFNTLEESKYTNELLERKLKNVMDRYSLTEDQLHYLISKFLDEGLLGGIAKWVGLPALGFLAATHGQDFINHFKNLQNKPSTEVSKEIKPAPELKEPISQKTLTAAKKSDKLNPKLAALSDVSKSVTSAADKATSGMEAASKKIDKMFGKKNK